MMEIKGEEISLSVDLERGSRITSLLWCGLEFVVQPRPSLMDWGWYAMVPWAGRVKNGLIKDKSGEQHSLPTNWEPPHAEHGFGFYSAWEKTSATSSRLQMPFPYEPAMAEQKIEVIDNSLRWTLEYTANGCEIPAWVGFHPWFARKLHRGNDAIVEFDAERMLVRGTDDIPTGEFSAPKPPPWNDAFIDVKKSPSILWPGAARVSISSNTPWWVVYTEDSEGVCIEPQSAPPDAANLHIVGAHSIEVSFTFLQA
jgi:aldose 1-epimerase